MREMRLSEAKQPTEELMDSEQWSQSLIQDLWPQSFHTNH